MHRTTKLTLPSSNRPKFLFFPSTHQHGLFYASSSDFQVISIVIDGSRHPKFVVPAIWGQFLLPITIFNRLWSSGRLTINPKIEEASLFIVVH
jgi:hypothetical protein